MGLGRKPPSRAHAVSANCVMILSDLIERKRSTQPHSHRKLFQKFKILSTYCRPDAGRTISGRPKRKRLREGKVS